jgi:MFS family permease
MVFISAYLCQGIAQHFCLVSQPLNNFLKAGLALDVTRVSMFVAFLMWPWVIKPLYGLLADFWQLEQGGPKRRMFLVLTHLLAGLAYLALVPFLLGLGTHRHIAWAAYPVIVLIAFAGVGIAFATVVFVAITVDYGRRAEAMRAYFGEQALAYSGANIASLALGGWLCASMLPAQALAWALVLAGLVLLMLGAALKRLLPEFDNQVSLTHCLSPAESKHPQALEQNILQKLKVLLGDRSYLFTLIFLSLWQLSPSLGVSLYFYECDTLRFSQDTIGKLSACTGAGILAGSFLFRCFLTSTFSHRRAIYVLILAGVASNLSYLLLHTPQSGMAIEFFRGVVTIVATLAFYGMAADVSPPMVTATAMAIQVAVMNLSSEGSIALGGFLYGTVFGRSLVPLVAVSGLTTFATVFFVPSNKNNPDKMSITPHLQLGTTKR